MRWLITGIVVLNVALKDTRTAEQVSAENAALRRRILDLEHKLAAIAKTAMSYSKEETLSDSKDDALSDSKEGALSYSKKDAPTTPSVNVGSGTFRRTKFLYKKISKTGCSSIAAMVRNVMKENGTIILEAHPMNRSALDDYFVVSSVRNPCEWHVSWAAYQARSNLHDCLVKLGKAKEIKFEHDQDFIDNWDTVTGLCPHVVVGEEAFDIGMKKNKGKLTEIMKWGLSLKDQFTPANLVNSAHCWVRTEAVYEDFKYCLQQYEKAGGYVDWSLLSPKSVPAHKNASPHEDCGTAFMGNPEYTMMVEDYESVVMEAFGYQCCEPSTGPVAAAGSPGSMAVRAVETSPTTTTAPPTTRPPAPTTTTRPPPTTSTAPPRVDAVADGGPRAVVNIKKDKKPKKQYVS